MKPVVAMYAPIEVELTKDQEYYSCRCGRSKNQPLCDGNHKRVPDAMAGREFALEGEELVKVRPRAGADPELCNEMPDWFKVRPVAIASRDVMGRLLRVDA